MNTEHDFWMTLYRHLYGILIAIRDHKLNEGKGKGEIVQTKPEATTLSTDYYEKQKR